MVTSGARGRRWARANANASAGGEGEDYGDDEEFGETFYVGDAECVCDVMIVDEDGREPREVHERGLDLRALRKEVEEDAVALMTLLLEIRAVQRRRRARERRCRNRCRISS